MNESISTRLVELFRLFLKLGLIAYGGPAAHIAMMHDEVVKRRKWLSEQQFLDLLGATNLIPGPNSTEMVLHVGYVRAGWRGLIVAGVCFILPAMLSVLALAWGYVRFGSLPAADWLLYGIKPVIIAIIAQALWNLGKKAAKGPLTIGVGIVVFGLYFLNINVILLLVAGGLIVVVGQQGFRPSRGRGAGLLAPVAGWNLVQALPTPVDLGTLFFIFLKVGATLYGSGYVLLAFLRSDLVTRLGWLTDQQLIDAIAVGQLTPGPVFTTATFIGYILGGLSGAMLATVGIFLPSFIFVALSGRFIPRLRETPWIGSLLDGVNAAALGLMAGVTALLGFNAFIDLPTVLLAILAALMLFRFKVSSVWLVVGGAVAGLILRGLIGL